VEIRTFDLNSVHWRKRTFHWKDLHAVLATATHIRAQPAALDTPGIWSAMILLVSRDWSRNPVAGTLKPSSALCGHSHWYSEIVVVAVVVVVVVVVVVAVVVVVVVVDVGVVVVSVVLVAVVTVVAAGVVVLMALVAARTAGTVHTPHSLQTLLAISPVAGSGSSAQ